MTSSKSCDCFFHSVHFQILKQVVVSDVTSLFWCRICVPLLCLVHAHKRTALVHIGVLAYILGFYVVETKWSFSQSAITFSYVFFLSFSFFFMSFLQQLCFFFFTSGGNFHRPQEVLESPLVLLDSRGVNKPTKTTTPRNISRAERLQTSFEKMICSGEETIYFRDSPEIENECTMMLDSVRSFASSVLHKYLAWQDIR